MSTLLRRGLNRIQHRIVDRVHLPVRHFKSFVQAVTGRKGIEIGGPSYIFRPWQPLPLYSRIDSLDNCDFSSSTVWAEHASEYRYSPGKPAGRSFFCEGSDLKPVADASYDFVLSSHNLEHFANPVKALFEWKRILRPGGALVLVLPYYRNTFDHRRSPTPVAAMLKDFDDNVGEDDLSHLPEILDLHDRSLDPASGSLEQFRQRSLDNLNNRCLHHHVFDERNSQDLLTATGFRVSAVCRARPHHLCLLAFAGESNRIIAAH